MMKLHFPKKICYINFVEKLFIRFGIIPKLNALYVKIFCNFWIFFTDFASCIEMF